MNNRRIVGNCCKWEWCSIDFPIFVENVVFRATTKQIENGWRLGEGKQGEEGKKRRRNEEVRCASQRSLQKSIFLMFVG